LTRKFKGKPLFKLNILYTIGKLLKLRYLKWFCFFNSSYENKIKLGVYKGIKEKCIGQGVKVIYLALHGTFSFPIFFLKPRIIICKDEIGHLIIIFLKYFQNYFLNHLYVK